MNTQMLDEVTNHEILKLLLGKLSTWYATAIKSIPNLIVAILVLLLFLLIAKAVRNLCGKVLPQMTKNKAVIDLFQSIIYFVVILLGFFVSLEVMNLEKTVTSILAGAGVIGLALGFAFQEIASNFVSGIFIAFREPYKLGDIVEVDNYFGEITKITLRTTSITTFQGLEVIIPNKYMFTKPFINLTTTPSRRLDLKVGVSYSDDLEKVTSVAKEALQSVEERVQNKEVEVFFEEFGDSSINFTARLWINYPRNQAFLKARHQAVLKIKAAFDREGITIPFPIRTIDYMNKNN